jgi:hypothetical protein
MTSTYEKIATNTLGSATASVTFSSITGTYTDLILVINGNSSTLADSNIRFNSDTASNYSVTRLYGNGSVAANSRSSNQSEIVAGDFNTTSNTTTIIQINNYSNSTTYKTALIRSGYAASIVFANVGLWRNTAAITSVTMFTSPGNFSTGCTFTIYGIKSE